MSYVTRRGAQIDLLNFSEHINLLYDRLGPTPRLCLNSLDDKYECKEYERELEKAISNVTPESLEALFDAAGTLEMDKLSHKICIIRRESLENVAGLAIVEPITPYIRSKLVYQLRILERRDQVRLYKRFAKTPDSRALACVAFEAAGQAMLQDGVKVELERRGRVLQLRFNKRQATMTATTGGGNNGQWQRWRPAMTVMRSTA